MRLLYFLRTYVRF